MTIVHISLHEQMDRRITGEMNHLARLGHQVIFLSRPVDLRHAGLSNDIDVVFAGAGAGGSGTGAKPRRLGLRQAVRRMVTSLPALMAMPLYRFMIGISDRRRFANFSQVIQCKLPGLVPDVIHVHDLRADNIALDLKRRNPKAVVVYDAHELTPFEHLNSSVSACILERERRFARQANVVITVNDGIARRMSELYGIKKPYVLLNSAEPLCGRSAAKTPRANGTDVSVIFQGSLTEGRNLENLVKAFAILPERYHLTILGDGRAKASIAALAGRNVTFKDPVPQDRLIAETSCYDFGIIPYMADVCENNRLCTPNKLFEFIEAGIPVCSSRLVEVDRILSRHGNGRCFDMDTAEHIAQAVRETADLLTAGEFGEARLQAAREAFSHERQMKVLEEAYGL